MKMKLLVYSYFPILADHQAGGAQLLMHDLLLGLAEAGTDVTVICPETNQGTNLSVDNLEVVSTFKEMEDRDLFVYERLHNLQQVANVVQYADVVWCLDRSFPLDIPQPIVMTLDTIAYKTELESFLELNWDALVVPSRYLFNIANVIVGSEAWIGSPPPIKLIPNGISTALFSPSNSADLCSRLGLSNSDRYLLFPHRPEPEKGFELAFRVLKQLLVQGQDYKLLIPTKPLSIKSEVKSEAKYYDKLRSIVGKMGIQSHVVFHDWILLDDLPAYFSLGKWSLALSTIPEGFGLTPVQSVSCGTPVICTKAGALRELFPPDHGVRYVDFDAVDQIISCILDEPSEYEIARGQAYLKDNYSIEKYVESYIACFQSARKNQARFNPVAIKPFLRLSPWCFFCDERSIWHDFKMEKYLLTSKESSLLQQIKAKVSVKHLSKHYYPELVKLLSQGIIVGQLARSM